MKSHLLLFFCLAVLQGFAQNVTFEAQIEATKVYVGRTIELSFVLKNGAADNFQEPKLPGFKVLNGPSRAFNQSIVNGVYSKSESFQYLLEAKDVGRFQISPAVVSVGGKKYATKAIEIEVVSEKNGKNIQNLPSNAIEEPVFVTAEVSSSSVYVGEQLRVLFRIFARVGVDGVDLLKMPSFDGFQAIALNRHDNRPGVQKVGKYEYQTQIISAYSLFPLKSGKLNIDPIHLQANAQLERGGTQDPLSSLLRRMMATQIRISSKAISIQVKDLPPAPAFFSGAVGQYQLEASSDKKEFPAHESATLRFSIKGNGLPASINPVLGGLDAFDAFQAKSIKSEEFETLDERQHEAQFEAFLMPKKEGEVDFRPLFSYFDPQKGSFEEASVDLGVLRILAAQKDNSNWAKDFTGIQGTTSDKIGGWFSDLRIKIARLSHSRLLWAFLLLPLLFVAYIAFFKKQKTKSLPSPASQSPKSTARPTAPLARDAPKSKPVMRSVELVQHLDSLSITEEPKRFFQTMRRGLHDNACMVMGLSPADTGRENLVEQLKKRNSNPEMTKELDELLFICEKVEFANAPSPLPKDVLLTRVSRVLNWLK